MKVTSDFHNFCLTATTQQRLQLFESSGLTLSGCQSVAQNSMTDKGATKPEETQYEWQPANCVDPVCISEKIRHESGPFPFGRLERNQITRERGN